MSWSLHLGNESPVDGHTYNLSRMWWLAGITDGSTKDLSGLTGRELASRCEKAVPKIINFRAQFESLNPENGWGDYEGFLETVMKLWQVAVANPQETAVWSG